MATATRSVGSTRRTARRDVADVGAQPGRVEAVGPTLDLADGARRLVRYRPPRRWRPVAARPAHDAASRWRRPAPPRAGPPRRRPQPAPKQALEQVSGQQRHVAHGDQHVTGLGGTRARPQRTASAVPSWGSCRTVGTRPWRRLPADQPRSRSPPPDARRRQRPARRARGRSWVGRPAGAGPSARGSACAFLAGGQDDGRSS